MSDLKRIEGRYINTEQGVTLFQDDPHYSPRPASTAELNVRKLAQALERARATFASCHGYEGAERDCERTLAEVAA